MRQKYINMIYQFFIMILILLISRTIFYYLYNIKLRLLDLIIYNKKINNYNERTTSYII